MPISVTDPASVVTCAIGSSTSRAGIRRVCSSCRLAGISIATSGVVLISADATPIGADQPAQGLLRGLTWTPAAPHVARDTMPVWTTPLAITSIAATVMTPVLLSPAASSSGGAIAQDAGDDERREQRDQRVDLAGRHRGQRCEDEDGGDGGHRVVDPFS